MAIYDPSTSDEIWYPIPDIPGYELSSELRVRKPEVGYGPERNRSGPRVPTGRWRIVAMRRLRGAWAFSHPVPGQEKWKTRYLHRIVATLAYGPIPDGLIVRHYDDNTDNNHASNLRIGTDADNAADRVRNGNSLKGEKNHQAILTEVQVREIRARSRDCRINDEIIFQLAREFGVVPGTIWQIKCRIRWKHIC